MHKVLTIAKEGRSVQVQVVSLAFVTTMKRIPSLQSGVCSCRCFSTSRPSSSTSSLPHDSPHDPYNAFASVFPASTSPSPLGPLSDLRISIKDNFATSSLPTTCSSRALQDYCSPFDATIVSLLRAKGATLVGKTNMDEFGMGSYGLSSYSAEQGRGVVRNPLDVERVAGGSSSGAAASVAAGLCDA